MCQCKTCNRVLCRVHAIQDKKVTRGSWQRCLCGSNFVSLCQRTSANITEEANSVLLSGSGYSPPHSGRFLLLSPAAVAQQCVELLIIGDYGTRNHNQVHG